MRYSQQDVLAVLILQMPARVICRRTITKRISIKGGLSTFSNGREHTFQLGARGTWSGAHIDKIKRGVRVREAGGKAPDISTAFRAASAGQRLAEAGPVCDDLAHNFDVVCTVAALLGDGFSERLRSLLATFEALTHPLLSELIHVRTVRMSKGVRRTIKPSPSIITRMYELRS
ncbi:MAG: hypothetical protein E7L38_10740 [Klebsiella pneumoniae]|nr:hypothetical protein [Klebsiella pneumoniae]